MPSTTAAAALVGNSLGFFDRLDEWNKDVILEDVKKWV